MSDQWGVTPGEQNAANTGGFTGGNINVSIPGMADMAAGIKQLTTNLQELRTTMSQFGSQQHQLGQGVAGTMQQVQTSALGATDSIKTFFQSMTGARPGAGSMATILDYGLASGIPQDLAMFPLRYLQSQIGQNRQFGLNVGGALAGQQYATGVRTAGGAPRGTGNMFSKLGGTFGAGLPGIPTGTGDEIAQFLNIARQAGAMVDLNNFGGGGVVSGGNPRTQGFITSAYQMQQMNPAMGLGEIGKSIGGFAANTAAQRQGAYLTGGAFSMVGRGGKLKSISEWSESILRWLEGQRPGPKRGQSFTYGELITQQYPGSNIDAWFDANGVPPDMQEQFWNYALAKSRTSGTTGGGEMQIESGAPTGAPNPAMQRLRATQPLTNTSFNLFGQLGGTYANREDTNRTFNKTLGSAMQRIIPSALGGPLKFAAELPDPVEEMIMSLLERIPLLGPAIGGTLGWGLGGAPLMETLLSEVGPVFGGLLDQIPDLADMVTQSLAIMMGEMTGGLGGGGGIEDSLRGILEQFQGGDVGDIGDWSPMGAKNPNSLHPSMSRKVSAMMKANPRLQVNSGRRDEVIQRKLRNGGHSRVSGKSSAHTRGLAADLGPRSQYGWIVANAHKFGLKSGVGHGEPWHVGMPGIGDIDIGESSSAPDDPAVTPPVPATTPPATSTGGSTRPKPNVTKYEGPAGLGGLLGLFGGGEADIAGSMGGLMSFLFGSFGGTQTSEADIEKALAYDPDFARKAFASATYTTGGKYGGGTLLAQVRDAIVARTKALYGTNAAAATTTGGATATGSETLAGALQALGIASTGLSSGAMVALLANKAGFTGDNLTAAVAIAGRESSFNPIAHRSDVDKAKMLGDRGLWQINAGAWNKLLISEGYIKDPLDRAIFDPWVNAQIAKMIYDRSGNFSAWTMGPNGWDPNGDPFYGTNRNDAEGFVKEAGLGDVDNYNPTPSTPVAIGGGNVHFSNTFVIQGGSGGGGIDTRRVVTQLADQLESEMRRRMARSN